MEHLNLDLGDLFAVEYYGNLFNPKEHSFHTFLESQGWALNDETLEFTKIRTSSEANFNRLLQSWLFFGLLITVLQLKPSEFNNNDFVKNDYIDTDNLSRYLEDWKRREMGTQNAHQRSLRMIRAQVALEKARQVVFEYCSMEGKHRTTTPGNPTIVDEDLGLSLMVLGETLMNAKSKIVERVGFNIRGWHGDANQGWGTPPCVLSRMMERKWCRRAVYVLRCQLRSHATALLSAYRSHDADKKDTETLIRGHEDCTEDQCEVKSEEGGIYKTQHQKICPLHNRTDRPDPYSSKEPCWMIGPDISFPGKLVKLIKEGQVPLLEYKEKDGQMIVDVVPCEPYAQYATISHVWSDGYGNPYKNELWKCQLDYFQDLFKMAASDHAPLQEPPKLFWIDTLAIPILDDDKEQRKTAIRQIFQIYTNAKYTIVIDKGLCQLTPGKTYEATAMKILLSGWMRRLWTLQEAYLSRRLFFAFAKNQVKNLDDLEELYPKANDILTSNIPNAARSYFHNLLGNDRRARINELPSGDGFDVLANVWRAARWRTTNHPEHETLALATLLNVDYERTVFQDAGIMKTAAPTEKQLEEMMKDLWELLDKTCPGSIPPGIIFLPGKRLSIPGFRWAPKTWMSAQELDYPDPLTNMTRAAKLVPEGLLVSFPGFLLHAKNRSSILKPNEDIFRFPSDSTLLEWYEVEVKENNSSAANKGINTPEKRLAIILCRERPRELREIALLVQIEEDIVQRNFHNQRRSKIYRVSIDRRVKIRREVNPGRLSRWSSYITDSAGHDDNMICGEVLDADQRWYVDGPRVDDTDMPLKPSPVENRRPDPPPKPAFEYAPPARAAPGGVSAQRRSATRRSPMMPSLSNLAAVRPPLPPRPDVAAAVAAEVVAMNGAAVESKGNGSDTRPPARTISSQTRRKLPHEPTHS